MTCGIWHGSQTEQFSFFRFCPLLSSALRALSTYVIHLLSEWALLPPFGRTTWISPETFIYIVRLWRMRTTFRFSHCRLENKTFASILVLHHYLPTTGTGIICMYTDMKLQLIKYVHMYVDRRYVISQRSHRNERMHKGIAGQYTNMQ
jgi:hypothetical protein